MKKAIDFYPSTEAEILGFNDDGTILCDLYGEVDGEPYVSRGVCFPADSPVLGLTPDEIGQIA